jgi:hypothetical protein
MPAQNGASIQFATPSEMLLLRAALLEETEAAEAAITWLTLYRGSAGPEFRDLELGSRRLLPLIYRNVKELLPLGARNELRKLYMECWSQNQQQFHRLAYMLKCFDSWRIPTMVLKGAALSALHYADKAVRPMSDFDILIPEQRAREIIRRLMNEGWTTTFYSAKAPRHSYFLRYSHATGLVHEEHGLVDLHWHVLAEATWRGADRTFWEDSIPLQMNGVTTRALNPTDQLLHACVHGYPASDVAPIRWIADACTVLRTSQIDWNRLLRLATDLQVTIPLRATLAFLKETFAPAIPQAIIDELAWVRVSTLERRYFKRLCSFEQGWTEVFANNCARHRRANRDLPPIVRLATLPLQFRLQYSLMDFSDVRSFTVSLLKKQLTRILGTS